MNQAQKTFVNQIRSNYVLFLVIIGFVIFKTFHLSLPYSWDETYSYLPAVLKMVENGPGLLPGAIPFDSAKGHPLMFYFLASIWINLFSGHIIAIRLFSLIISIITLAGFYIFARRHTNQTIANLAVALLAVQSLFLAQATLILPEMFLTLLLIISLDFFLSGKFGLFAISGSVMVLAKETGVVFIFIFGLFYLLENLRQIRAIRFWKHILLLGIPALVYCLYLLLYYLEYGCFFYKEHLGYITFDLDTVFRKANSAFANLFTRYGRNLISLMVILSLITFRFRKLKIENRRLIYISMLLIFSLLLFSSINFYTYRYMLPAFPLYIVVCSTILYQAKFRSRILNAIIPAMIIVLPFYKSITKTAGGLENDLSYTEYLVLHKRVVEYCEEQSWYDKKFTCGMNLVMAMRYNYAGYLTSTKNFKTDHYPRIDGADFVIFDSTCAESEFPEELRKEYRVVKHFVYKKHWCYIYSKSP